MAINPNNGVLDIINGTLKVSSIDIKQAGGFTTAINTVARNDVLLFDDQKSTTTFTPTAQGGYMSSTGVTRDTSSNYLELGTASDAGWVYWPLQLPNSWHTEFDMHVTATGGVLTYSLFNTSEPNHTDYTNNDGGYKIVFDNTNNQIVIYWEGSVHKTVSATLRSNDWQSVNINYFQGAISVSLAGKVVLTHEFTQNYQEFDSRYVGFSATAGTSHKIRHLRIHNSDKWLYTKTSNASDISYVSGNVGIGSLSPTELLDVHGNVHIASDLTVDGNLTVTGTTTYVDTTNATIEDPIIELAKGNTSDIIDAGLIVSRGASNVAIAFRGDEEELAFGYTQSGASDADVTPITNGGLDVRVYGNLFANNLTTTANVEATYLKGNGSEITHVTLDQVVGYANTTANTIQLTNSDVGLKVTGNVDANYFVGNGSKLTGLVTDLQSVADNGNTSSNTIQFTNATTAFVADSNVGIGTDAPTANLHVMGYQYVNGPPTLTNAFDHSDAPLTLTHGTATSDTAINDPKPLLHLTRDGTTSQSYGARASFNLSRYENSSTHSRSRLDLALADGTYAESTVMTLRADGKVGVGTTSPRALLDVSGPVNVPAILTSGASSSEGDIAVVSGEALQIGHWDNGTSTFTNRIHMDSDGNVGIGVSPVTPLHVSSTNFVSDTAGPASSANTVVRFSSTEVDSTLLFGLSSSASYISSFSKTGFTTERNLILNANGGNVGIGTTSPLQPLHVKGNDQNPVIYMTDATNNRYASGMGTHNVTNVGQRLDFYNGDSGTNGTSLSSSHIRMSIDANGNVGIGTTSPGVKLQVGSNTETTPQYIRIRGERVNQAGDICGIQMYNSLNSGDRGNSRITNSRGANNYGSNLEFWTNPDSNVPATEKMRITSTGNVGIGTDSPDHMLHVNGNVKHGGANTYLSWNNSQRLIVTYDNSYRQGIHFEANSRLMRLFSTTNDSGGGIVFQTRAGSGSSDTDYGSERMRITSAGNVGIGMTNPTRLLEVNGTSQFWGEMRWDLGTNASHAGYGSSKSWYIRSGSSSGNVIIQDSGGNVGIGDSSPSYKLSVQGSFRVHGNASTFGSDGLLHINSRSTTYGSETVALQTTIDGRALSDSNPGTYGGESRNVIALQPDGGYVGIGTVSPSSKLHLRHGSGDNVTTFKVNSGGYLRIERNHNNGPWIQTTMGSGMAGIHLGNSDNWLIRKWYANLDFDYNGSTKGYLLHNSTVNQIDFTGQHRSFIDDVLHTEYDSLEGLIVSANKNKYFDIDEDLTTGANAIQISQSIPLVSISTKEKDKACFGVISGSEDPDSRKYEQGSFVTVVEKQVGDRRAFINSVGEGAIWVTNINGNLESGDYITTSNVAGYGMLQDDDILHNYTVAKITMDCDFAPATQPVQQIVKELSNVNYWVNTTYTDVELEEYSNLTEENRQTVTTTQYSNEEGNISVTEYSNLESNVQATYSEIETVTYQKIEREESKIEQEGWTLEVREELVNVLDEHDQLQWEDHPTDTEKAYKIRYLTADGQITDEANAVHIAAFVGCTYHCG